MAPQIGRACPAAVPPSLREAAFPGGASPLVAPGSCDSADGPCLAPNDRYFPADALSSVARSCGVPFLVLGGCGSPAGIPFRVLGGCGFPAGIPFLVLGGCGFPASVPFRCAYPMPECGVAVHFFLF